MPSFPDSINQAFIGVFYGIFMKRIKFYKELEKEIKKTTNTSFWRGLYEKKKGLWDNLIWRKQILEAI